MDRLQELDLSRYDTDKITNAHYLRNYGMYLEPYRSRDIRLLELGVRRGGSLLLWRDYFERGIIAGLDLDPIPPDDSSGRIRTYRGSQDDTALLDRIAAECAPDGFDIIIDDCSHIGELTKITFWHLFERHLKPGGMYVIEDWGTGYWRRWIDGAAYRPPSTGQAAFRRFLREGGLERIPVLGRLMRKKFMKRRMFAQTLPSHAAGMVGFVKELVDECGMGDITYPDRGVGPRRSSRFERMVVGHSQVFVFKAE